MSYEQLMDHAIEIQQKAIHEGIASLVVPYGQAREPIVADIERRFAGVAELFVPFVDMPDPRDFQSLVESMNVALGKLAIGGHPNADPSLDLPTRANSELAKMSGSESYLAQWTGRAAEEFKTNFIDPFPATASNQFLLAFVLKWSLVAEQQIWEDGRKEIDKIAEMTIAALEQLPEAGAQAGTILLTVVGAILTVASLWASGGILTGLTVAAAAVAVGGTLSSPEPTETTIEGNTADAVIASMREAMDTLVTHIATQESFIADLLARVLQMVAADRTAFLAKRPLLAGANPSNVTSPAYMGYSV